MMTAPSELEIWKLLEEGGRWQYGPGMWMSQGSGKGRPLNVLYYTSNYGYYRRTFAQAASKSTLIRRFFVDDNSFMLNVE
jgi:hypothetical protein